MNFEQYNTLLEYGRFMQYDADGKVYVGVLPNAEYDAPKVDKVIEDILSAGKDYPWTMEKFTQYAQKYTPLRNAQINKAFKQLETLSVEQLAQLSDDQRLDILEKIMPSKPQLKDIEKLKPHKEKIEQLLFNLKFPAQFWEEEQRLAMSFVNRLQTIPHIKDNIQNWQQLETPQQKECLQRIADVFCKTYQMEPIAINFFTEAEYNEDRRRQGLDEKLVPPTGTALADKREISFCTDRIKICDNYVPIYLTFHEALHISQRERSFERYPQAARMLNEKFKYFQCVTEGAYLTEPSEVHAYGIDAMVREKAPEVLKVPFVDNKYDEKTRRAVDAATRTAQVLYAYNVKE